MSGISVIIPARNEIYLEKTIQNVMNNIRGDSEIIVILDGYLPEPPIITNDPRVTFIHYETSIGQRAVINAGVRKSTKNYILKLDAHCAIDEGMDVKLMEDCEYNWTVIPRMYNLDSETWLPKTHKRTDYMHIGIRENGEIRSEYFKGREFKKWHNRPDLIDDTMGLMGPCFFMHKDWYWELDGCDESHEGGWGQQGIEVSMKTLTAGGRLVVNKKTWFSHWFRGHLGFPYHMSGKQINRVRAYSKDLWLNNKWKKQIYPVSAVFEKFFPVPTWDGANLKMLKDLELRCERSGIYFIKNTEDGKVYIGSTENLSKIFEEHLCKLKETKHENDFLQKSWNKYGEDKFSFNVLFFCKPEELLIYEQALISKAKDELGQDNIFNLSLSENSITEEQLNKKSNEILQYESSEKIKNIINEIIKRLNVPPDKNGKFLSEMEKQIKEYAEENMPEDKSKIDELQSYFYKNTHLKKKDPRWRGIKVLKFPSDFLLYSQVIWEKKPDFIVEIGTAYCGSALFFADMLNINDKGRVISIDVSPRGPLVDHPRITYLSGDSKSPDIIKKVKELVGNNSVMVSIDGKHERVQVKWELKYYSEIVTSGQYLVVEDCYDRNAKLAGPGEARDWFLSWNRKFTKTDLDKQFLIGMTKESWLLKK